MEKFLDLEVIVNHLANMASTINNKDHDIQILDGYAEVEINGTEYQVQVVLEPRKHCYCREDNNGTFRKTVE